LLLGPGICFGDDDVLSDRPYKATLKCTSLEGSLYVFHKEDFLRIFKSENESWHVEF